MLYNLSLSRKLEINSVGEIIFRTGQEGHPWSCQDILSHNLRFVKSQIERNLNVKTVNQPETMMVKKRGD